MGVPPSAHVLEKGWTALHFAALQGNEVRSCAALPHHPSLSGSFEYNALHCINPILLRISIADTSPG